jgi:hypothetical protein
MTAVIVPACFVRRSGVPSTERETGPGGIGWRSAETAELLRLYAALSGRVGAAGFDYGETETGDPQFYVLGRGADCSCIAFVSRLAVDGEPRYIVQDGTGRVVAESHSLEAAIDAAIPLWRRSQRADTTPARRLLRVLGVLMSVRLALDRMIEEGAPEALRVGFEEGVRLLPLVGMIA